MKRHIWVSTLFIVSVIVFGVICLFPQTMIPLEQKPDPVPQPQPVYDHYLIIDEKSGQHLMYVPLLVSIDDELISEDNKRYRVTRIEENRAYARFIENVDLKKYKSDTQENPSNKNK